MSVKSQSERLQARLETSGQTDPVTLAPASQPSLLSTLRLGLQRNIQRLLELLRETFLFRREEREEEEATGTGDKALATKRSKQNKNRRLKNGRQVSLVFFLLT